MIPRETLTAIFQRKPESLAGRMARELANEPGIGGGWWLALLLAGAATIGFILAGGI
jgi:hypothetical protein